MNARKRSLPSLSRRKSPSLSPLTLLKPETSVTLGAPHVLRELSKASILKTNSAKIRVNNPSSPPGNRAPPHKQPHCRTIQPSGQQHPRIILPGKLRGVTAVGGGTHDRLQKGRLCSPSSLSLAITELMVNLSAKIPSTKSSAQITASKL